MDRLNECLSHKIDSMLLLSHVSCVWLCDPIEGSPPGSHPWDSPGKNTGVGCHFLFQCMKVKSENEVAQLCPTLRDPMDCSLPGSSVHGIFQARVLEWGAIAFCDRLSKCWLLLNVDFSLLHLVKVVRITVITSNIYMAINVYQVPFKVLCKY